MNWYHFEKPVGDFHPKKGGFHLYCHIPNILLYP
jgi:hypothetical protein